MHKNTRVLFICRKRLNTYGNSIGLVNSAQFIANFLIAHGIDAKVVSVNDANGIDREVYLYKPTHVVIHAIWVTVEKMTVLLSKYPKIQWQVRIHSKIPFLSHEGQAVDWIRKYEQWCGPFHNFELSCNNPATKTAFEESVGIEFLYLPNVYQPDYAAEEAEKCGDDILDIGCFGAIRPFKNQLMQAMAAMAFGNEVGRRIRFHINSDRTEQTGESVLKNLRALFAGTKHILAEHPWMNHKDFLKLVSGMDFGMQVSLSETFNIVAADFVYSKVPVVSSAEIEWMPESMHAEPHSIEDIVAKLKRLYHLKRIGMGWVIPNTASRRLRLFNCMAGRMWLRYLRKNPC